MKKTTRPIQIIISAAMMISLSACAAEKPAPVQPSATEPPQITESSSSAMTGDTSSAPQPENPSDISQYNTADDILSAMTPEEKIGQLILGRFPANAEETAEKYHVGGFVLYARDFQDETPESISGKLGKIQSNSFIPLFTAVDEEGGTVVRVSKYPQYRLLPFSSQIALARGGEELIDSETREKSELLLSLGINLNLAPVADFTENHSSYIFDRTFGTDLEKTSEYTALTVSVMNECGIGSCLKHFPGYGPNDDTHTGIAEDDRNAEEFESADFLPFLAGIEAGAPSVMVCHNIVKAFDSEMPASLSPAVHSLLRENMGFEGVIISDDMGMEAILQFSGDESPYVLAVLAGNDIICTSDIEAAYNDILDAVNDGRIAQERVDESVLRILTMKKGLKLF